MNKNTQIKKPTTEKEYTWKGGLHIQFEYVIMITKISTWKTTVKIYRHFWTTSNKSAWYQTIPTWTTEDAVTALPGILTILTLSTLNVVFSGKIEIQALEISSERKSSWPYCLLITVPFIPRFTCTKEKNRITFLFTSIVIFWNSID